MLWTQFQGQELGKKLSPWMVKKVLKTARYTWRRVPKSIKKQRNEGLYAFFEQEIQLLLAEARQGLICLWFYDESGFNLNPNAMYAWLPPHCQIADLYLPAQRGNLLTVAGFLSAQNQLEAYAQNGAMTSESFIAFTEDFIQNQVKTTQIKHIVILDNASFHTSKVVKLKMEEWKKQNLFFQFLPPYSSQLNRIEILWHHVKHYWLEIQDFESPKILQNAVINILKKYNSKYTITFS